MTKIYIIQSYNTTESDIYNLDPDYIENIITNNKEDAQKICDYINEYNEDTTGVDDQINSRAKIIEIDLDTIEFETYKSMKQKFEGELE
jgi:uncharacterized lipoprotein YehR (DUF1307 family)